MKKTINLLLIITFFSFEGISQTNTTWNGKKCAVVLTYDDGLNVDLTNAIPALDSVGLKGTFYICNYAGHLYNQIDGWRKAAKKGHELANHTVTHPCNGGPGREFVTPEYDLRNYSLKRIADDARTMNIILKAIDGKTTRTFAFPCADNKINDTPYINTLKKDFIAARSVGSQMLKIDKVDLYNLPCYMINGQSGEEMIALVDKAMATNSLLIFLFHGVGGEHGLNVTLPAHTKLLKYLKEHKKEVWTAPMVDVAEYVYKYQAKNK